MNVEEIRKKVRSLCEDAGLQFFFAVPNASEWAVIDCEHLRKIVSYHKKLETLPLVTPTQKWIPVSERLPKENTSYLVTDKQGCIMIAIWCGNPEYWRNIIAWMPLPKPYKGSEVKEWS